MKKLTIIAVVLAMGVSVGFASSLKVPWFVDNAAPASFPSVQAGRAHGVITLASNRTDAVTCAITYYSAEGAELGPYSPVNTFEIDPLSALAFRPVADDPGSVPGGMESEKALLVPNRPRDVDTKKNGSCTVEWVGDPTDIQGQVSYMWANGTTLQTMSYAHLLPPGPG